MSLFVVQCSGRDKKSWGQAHNLDATVFLCFHPIITTSTSTRTSNYPPICHACVIWAPGCHPQLWPHNRWGFPPTVAFSSWRELIFEICFVTWNIFFIFCKSFMCIWKKCWPTILRLFSAWQFNSSLSMSVACPIWHAVQSQLEWSHSCWEWFFS